MKAKRNDKCPCGSGKKYKNCCLQKDLAEAQAVPETPETEEQYEENPAPSFATWKIFLITTAILATIWIVFWLAFDLPRVGGSIFGCGMLILIVLSAFRNPPTVRKRPGNAGNIDFGNRP